MISQQLRQWRKSHGLTQGALAKKLNVTAATVSRWEKGLMAPQPAHIQQIEKIFQDAPLAKSALLKATSLAPNSNGTASPAAQPHTSQTASIDEEITPIYLCKKDKDGKLSLYNSTIIEEVQTPTPLKKVTGGFGIYMPNEEMDPTFKTGDLLFIHPNKPVNIGDDVLLLLREKGRTQPTALIRRLEEKLGTSLKFRQWTPYKDESHPTQQIVQCYKIVARHYA